MKEVVLQISQKVVVVCGLQRVFQVNLLDESNFRMLLSPPIVVARPMASPSACSAVNNPNDEDKEHNTDDGSDGAAGGLCRG